jgi:GNAT superfamily N-acetyltransferase
LGEILIRDHRPEADEPALADLWRRVFGHPSGGQTIEWLFRPGPAGPSPRAVAEDGGRIVAHAGATALRFRLDGAEVRGGYSVAAMTDPAYRGQRLFFRVGEHLYRRMQEQGFAFVAGFSNANSFRLMTGPLQRVAVRPFPWSVRPLPASALGWIARRVPRGPDEGEESHALAAAERDGVALSTCTPDDRRLDEVWRRAAPAVSVGAVRDAAFAAWRFGTRPDARYRIVLAERAGQPAGWLAYRGLALRGVPAGFVVDLVLAQDEAAAGRSLLGAAARIARAEGALLLSALAPGAGPARRALRRAGFVRVPEALHPQVIRFSVRGLGTGAVSPRLTRASDWHLAWSDTDVV